MKELHIHTVKMDVVLFYYWCYIFLNKIFKIVQKNFIIFNMDQYGFRNFNIFLNIIILLYNHYNYCLID
jgi:hypothetical protein